MAWFKKARKPIEAKDKPSSRVPEGLWVKCPGCAQAIYNKDLAANLQVCPKCGHHNRVNATERLKMLFDLAYSANLEKFASFLATELSVIAKTPLVMLRMTQGR